MKYRIGFSRLQGSSCFAYVAPTTILTRYLVDQIPCQDCSWSYIGETGRSLKTRKSEHVRNVKQSKKGSNVAKHAWTQDHVIDCANAKVIDKGIIETLKP